MRAKSLQSFPTLCNPIDCSPPDFSISGILQARILVWVAIFFSRWRHQKPSDQPAPSSPPVRIEKDQETRREGPWGQVRSSSPLWRGDGFPAPSANVKRMHRPHRASQAQSIAKESFDSRSQALQPNALFFSTLPL